MEIAGRRSYSDLRQWRTCLDTGTFLPGAPNKSRVILGPWLTEDPADNPCCSITQPKMRWKRSFSRKERGRPTSQPLISDKDRRLTAGADKHKQVVANSLNKLSLRTRKKFGSTTRLGENWLSHLPPNLASNEFNFKAKGPRRMLLAQRTEPDGADARDLSQMMSLPKKKYKNVGIARASSTTPAKSASSLSSINEFPQMPPLRMPNGWAKMEKSDYRAELRLRNPCEFIAMNPDEFIVMNSENEEREESGGLTVALP